MGFRNFFDLFLETRKYKKPSPVEQIKRYNNDPNVFISFTDIEKLGINPRSRYNTPIGIYSYPVKEMWSDLEKYDIPFAKKRPYIWIFKASNPDRVAYSSSYQESNFISDLQKLRERYPTFNRDIDHKELYLKEKYKPIDRKKHFISYLTYFIGDQKEYGIPEDDLITEEDILIMKMVLDKIRNNENDWEDVLREKLPDIYEEIDKPYKTHTQNAEKIIESDEELLYMASDLLLSNISRPYKNTYIKKMWAITRYIASNDPIKWGRILSFLYDGIVDDKGEGFIHINEPRQAVFFNIKKIKIIDLIKRTDEDEWFPKSALENMRYHPLVVAVLKNSLDDIPFQQLTEYMRSFSENEWSIYFKITKNLALLPFTIFLKKRVLYADNARNAFIYNIPRISDYAVTIFFKELLKTASDDKQFEETIYKNLLYLFTTFFYDKKIYPYDKKRIASIFNYEIRYNNDIPQDNEYISKLLDMIQDVLLEI